MTRLNDAWDYALHWLMHPLFDKLVTLLTVALAAWAITASLDASNAAERIAQENAAIAAAAALNTDQVVIQARDQCERSNALRESAALLLRQQYNSSQRLIERPGGLGSLERFRSLIKRQQAQRLESLRLIRLAGKDLRVKGHPDRIDCTKAFPYQRRPRP